MVNKLFEVSKNIIEPAAAYFLAAFEKLKDSNSISQFVIANSDMDIHIHVDIIGLFPSPADSGYDMNYKYYQVKMETSYSNNIGVKTEELETEWVHGEPIIYCVVRDTVNVDSLYNQMLHNGVQATLDAFIQTYPVFYLIDRKKLLDVIKTHPCNTLKHTNRAGTPVNVTYIPKELIGTYADITINLKTY